MSKTHAPSEDTDPSLCGSLCGWLAVTVTHDPEGVTCLRCKALLKKRAQSKPRVVSMEEAMRDVLRLIGGMGQTLPPKPTLTPDVWRSMRCRQEGVQVGKPHCYCDLCSWEDETRKARADWLASDQNRPHRVHAHPFGSVRAALELLLRWRQDGASARSSQGGIQSRLTETASLGTQVQTTVRCDRDSLEVRRADMCADIEAACLRAYAEEQSRQGLTPAQCVTILLDGHDPEGKGSAWWAERLELTERAVKSMVSHGRKVVTVDLVVSGYIPPPRSRDGLDEAIERRRREVAA